MVFSQIFFGPSVLFAVSMFIFAVRSARFFMFSPQKIKEWKAKVLFALWRSRFREALAPLSPGGDSGAFFTD